MPRPIAVHALPDYRIQLRYDDGVEGEVDLSDLVGKGVFFAWAQPGAFDAVTIGPGDSIAWSEEIELCPDSLYLEITGQQAEAETGFRLTPEEQALLLAATQQAERGEVVDGRQLLDDLRD